MASLATFLAGLYSLRVLDPSELGTYALFFSAFITVMAVSGRLIFLPAEITATLRPLPHRLGVLSDSLRLGVPVAVVAGTAVAAAALVAPAEVTADVVVPLLVTSVACTMVSPVQDHIRRMFHVGQRSWRAAWISAGQLAGVVVFLGVLRMSGVARTWHPFGALASANVASCILGIALWIRIRGGIPPDPVPLRTLLRPGKWLVVVDLAPQLAGFVAAALVANLSSAQTLGYAEGARVLARPVAVLAAGLMAVLGPRLMSAAANRDAAEARRLSQVYAGVLAASGSAYLLLAGFDWVGNPLPQLVPTAYAVPGLAALSIIAYTVDRAAGGGARPQLLGAARERRVAAVETVASSAWIVAGATAPVTGAFAMPIGYLAMAIVRQPWLRSLARKLYLPVAP